MWAMPYGNSSSKRLWKKRLCSVLTWLSPPWPILLTCCSIPFLILESTSTFQCRLSCILSTKFDDVLLFVWSVWHLCVILYLFFVLFCFFTLLAIYLMNSLKQNWKIVTFKIKSFHFLDGIFKVKTPS